MSYSLLTFHRPLLTGQWRLQPQLHGGPWWGCDLFLSTGHGVRAQQQDLPDPELLCQTPHVQSALWTGQVQCQMLMLWGLGTGAWHGELQEHRWETEEEEEEESMGRVGEEKLEDTRRSEYLIDGGRTWRMDVRVVTESWGFNVLRL